MKAWLTIVALMGVFLLLQGCNTPDTTHDRVPDWAKGGTLHDTTLRLWPDGREEDKLATAGEVLYEALWQGHLQSDEYIAAFRAQSEKLVMMMDDMSGLLPRMVQVNPSTPLWTIRSFVSDSVKDDHEMMDQLVGPASVKKAVTPTP